MSLQFPNKIVFFVRSLNTNERFPKKWYVSKGMAVHLGFFNPARNACDLSSTVVEPKSTDIEFARVAIP